MGCPTDEWWWHHLTEEWRWPHFIRWCSPCARTCLPPKKKPTATYETNVDLSTFSPMTAVVAPTRAQNQKKNHPSDWSILRNFRNGGIVRFPQTKPIERFCSFHKSIILFLSSILFFPLFILICWGVTY